MLVPHPLVGMLEVELEALEVELDVLEELT